MILMPRMTPLPLATRPRKDVSTFRNTIALSDFLADIRSSLRLNTTIYGAQSSTRTGCAMALYLFP